MLIHPYHTSLNLPREWHILVPPACTKTKSRPLNIVWTPSPIQIGDVGYHKRPSGSFVKLFNAFDPVGTATSHSKVLAPLIGVQTATQTDTRRTFLQRGLSWVGGFLKSPTPKGMSPVDSGTPPSREVARKYDFLLRAGHKRSMLVAEATTYVRDSFTCLSLTGNTDSAISSNFDSGTWSH